MQGENIFYFPNNRILLRGLSANARQTSFLQILCKKPLKNSLFLLIAFLEYAFNIAKT